MISILLKPLYDGALKKLHINPGNFLWKLFQMLRTFVIVCIGYVFDVAPSFLQAIRTFANIIHRQNIKGFLSDFGRLGLTRESYRVLLLSTVILLIVSIWQEKHPTLCLRKFLDQRPYILRWLLICFAVSFVFLFGVYGPEYSVTGFVYARF